MQTLKTRTNLSALNTQQRKAVLSNKKNVLVLAGAGSGKTNTLLQKINYLINDVQANAKSILAITFTKNAANEMVDRMILSADTTGFYKQVLETNGITQKEINIERKKMLNKYPWLNQITIKTFHSLGYQIMREDGVFVFDNQFKIIPKSKNTNSEFSGNSATETESEIIQKVTIEHTEKTEFLITLKRYILDYFVDKIHQDESNLEFRPEGRFFTTLKGEHVRSKSEQFIADWLFRNNIEYKYEYKERVSKSSFHPDFFIPKANIYLEHVSDLSHPTFWKELELKKGGITCIKTYDKATHNTAVFNQVLNKVIKGRITENISSNTVLNYYEEFAGFKKELNKFYRLVIDVKGALNTSNKSNYEILKIASKSKHERVRLFYQLAIPIIESYHNYCENRSYLDFNGLIDYSIKLFKEYKSVRERYQQRFKYILVDEFQDVNNQQVEFLKQLVSKNAQLFCVGDDWQSIYGFRGSEIEYIVNFKKHFRKPEVITLNLNYRSTDCIVKASNEIIKKNHFQVEKNISAVQKGGAKIEVHYAQTEGDEESFIWSKIEHHINKGIHPEEILILYRRTAMKQNIQDALENSGVKVQYKTIHSAKGLEAKVVFILGLNASPGGFPDPWMQDKIYSIIKQSEYNTLLEEERRLFYVALTRAKNHLYLMSQKGSVSEFVKDIPKNLLLINENEIEGIEHKIELCEKCNSKIEEHYKFCPICGANINMTDEEKMKKIVSYIENKVSEIKLHHNGWLDSHIYEARLKNKRAYEPWSAKEDDLLRKHWVLFKIDELSDLFERSERSINSRMVQLKINT